MVTKYWQLDVLIEAAEAVCPTLNCSLLIEERFCKGRDGVVQFYPPETNAPPLIVLHPDLGLEDATSALHDFLCEVAVNPTGKNQGPEKEQLYDETWDAIGQEFDKRSRVLSERFVAKYSSCRECATPCDKETSSCLREAEGTRLQ